MEVTLTTMWVSGHTGTQCPDPSTRVGTILEDEPFACKCYARRFTTVSCIDESTWQALRSKLSSPSSLCPDRVDMRLELLTKGKAAKEDWIGIVHGPISKMD
ncbi:hypothetical protein WJX77_010901 [Trebouxia sp. C0004]